MHIQKRNYRILHVILLFDLGLCNDEISSFAAVVKFRKKEAWLNNFQQFAGKKKRKIGQSYI